MQYSMLKIRYDSKNENMSQQKHGGLLNDKIDLQTRCINVLNFRILESDRNAYNDR